MRIEIFVIFFGVPPVLETAIADVFGKKAAPYSKQSQEAKSTISFPMV